MRRLRLAAVTLALVGAAVVVPAALAVGNTPQQNIPYDQSPLLDGAKAPAQKYANGIYPSTNPDGVGDSVDPPLHDGRAPDLSLTLYDFSSTSNAGPHQVPFWKEYAGAHSDIYVAWNDLAAPAASVQQDQTITSSQVAYIGQEFDERIWESDVFHFGNYKPRCPAGTTCDGSRAAIMVYNIRDDAYWTSFRFYIAGFFWSSLNEALGLNAVFVDSFNWKDRLGAFSARPFLYEGVVAHEFEHLIHNDVDPDEDSSIDEGMADLAEQFIYGTPTTSSHIANYLVYHRDSTTDWDGELYDYGNAVLFQDYLWERSGGGDLDAPLAGRVTKKYAKNRFADTADKFTDPGDKFIWNLIHDQANSVAGVANQVGGLDAAKAIHRDYTLANLLDGKVSESQWNYRNLVLGGADSDGYSIDDGIAYYDSNVSGNMPPTRKNVRRRTVVEPWGAYYRTFTGSQPGITMSFTGNATDGVAAHSAPTHWYSGLGNQLDISVRRAFTVAAGNTLGFWTWFDIEEDWDYGYVEASADNGQTWQKLSQVTTLRTGASNINGSSAWDGAGGFTGSSGGYQQAEFSFGGLTGTVLVRFRYVTDESVNGQGWYVDDLTVGSTTDPVTDASAWTNQGWTLSTGLQTNSWTADAYATSTKAQTSSYALYPFLLSLVGGNVQGSVFVDSRYIENGQAYGIVGNRPDGPFDATGRLTIAK